MESEYYLKDKNTMRHDHICIFGHNKDKVGPCKKCRSMKGLLGSGYSLLKNAENSKNEWIEGKNSPVTLSDITYNSDYQAYFKCSHCSRNYKLSVSQWYKGKKSPFLRCPGCSKVFRSIVGIAIKTILIKRRALSIFRKKGNTWEKSRREDGRPYTIINSPFSSDYLCIYGHQQEVGRCGACCGMHSSAIERGHILFLVRPDSKKEWDEINNEPVSGFDVPPGSRFNASFCCSTCKTSYKKQVSEWVSSTTIQRCPSCKRELDAWIKFLMPIIKRLASL